MNKSSQVNLEKFFSYGRGQRDVMTQWHYICRSLVYSLSMSHHVSLASSMWESRFSKMRVICLPTKTFFLYFATNPLTMLQSNTLYQMSSDLSQKYISRHWWLRSEYEHMGLDKLLVAKNLLPEVALDSPGPVDVDILERLPLVPTFWTRQAVLIESACMQWPFVYVHSENLVRQTSKREDPLTRAPIRNLGEH